MEDKTSLQKVPGSQERAARHRQAQVLALWLLAVLLAACNQPLAHLEAGPLAVARTAFPERRTGRPATAFVSPLSTPASPTLSTPLAVASGGSFSGRSLHFDLPPGYQVLEATDGGCFLYPASRSGFLVLYRDTGQLEARLAGLLAATPGLRDSEPLLEVDLGGRTFVGLFVETKAGQRLFLAAAEDWTLVVQGPLDDWPTLAGALNQMLRSLTFEEEAR